MSLRFRKQTGRIWYAIAGKHRVGIVSVDDYGTSWSLDLGIARAAHWGVAKNARAARAALREAWELWLEERGLREA